MHRLPFPENYAHVDNSTSTKTEAKKSPGGEIRIYEGPFSRFWLDEYGILHAQSQNIPRTLQGQKDTTALIGQITGNKKVCMLADTTLASPMDKEVRLYVAREMPSIFNAVAVISSSVLGRFFGNLFVGLKNNLVPMKLFTNEEEAITWLKQYL